MKLATVKYAKIYKFIIVSSYFKLFPEKQLKGPYELLGMRLHCLKRNVSKQRT